MSPLTVSPVRVPTEVRLEVTTVLLRVVPVKVPAAAVIVIADDPLNDTPFILLAVAKTVAVAAFPVMSDDIVAGKRASGTVQLPKFVALRHVSLTTQTA